MSNKRQNKKRAPSVLGLTLRDGQLRACHVTRAKGKLEVMKTAQAALTLDLLHPEAELVGREIKNQLDAAGIRERQVVVGIPPRWVMSLHTKVPEIPAEDLASFLQIEAEKGFPVDPAQLQIAQSTQRSTGGTFVTQLGVRQEQIDQLLAVLKAAGLKPVSFSLGLASFPHATKPPDGRGRITVAVDSAGVTFLIAAGGGIASLRTCDANVQSEAGEKIVNGAAVARELRITFEQAPPELRAEVKDVFLTGETMLVRQLAESLAPWANSVGLKITRDDLPEQNLLARETEQLATNWVENTGPELEFLPPRPSRWALLMARYSSRRLATAGFAAAGLAAVLVVAFSWHEGVRLMLRSEWNGMQAQVTQLDGVKAKIREFQPFYDTSFRALTVMKRVTECFPDNGSVTAKTFELHGNGTVTISGTVRDNAALLHVQEELHKAKNVQGLQIEQIRGKVPMQFTLTFHWNANSGT